MPELMTRRRLLQSLSVSLIVASSHQAHAAAFNTSAFPLTVSHALGNVTIPRQPTRIVTLGWNGEDAVVALGSIPVAMPRRALFEGEIFPWVEDKIGNAEPHLLSGDFNYEQIAVLKPDLILGVFSGIGAKAYARLSRIAPTVVYRSGPWQADWREQTRMTGLALGQAECADALVENTTGFLRSLAATHDKLQGKSFVFGTYNPGSSEIGVYLPSDPRIELLQELGLRPSSGIEALAAQRHGRRSASVSLETVEMIDSDILIMWYGSGARAAAEAQPLFKRLPAVRRHSYVALEDAIDIWSTSALSVLSIPYGFPRFVPRLAEAARRVNGD